MQMKCLCIKISKWNGENVIQTQHKHTSLYIFPYIIKEKQVCYQNRVKYLLGVTFSYSSIFLFLTIPYHPGGHWRWCWLFYWLALFVMKQILFKNCFKSQFCEYLVAGWLKMWLILCQGNLLISQNKTRRKCIT